MGWFGKLTGGTVGFFLGGPLGALLGTVIGHSFDKRSKIHVRIGRGREHHAQNFTANDQAQMVFFVATFSMLGKMLAAGKGISNAEIRVIEDFIDRDLRLNIAEKEFAMRIVNTAAASREPFEKFAQQFYAQFHRHPQMLHTMYDILCRVADADNKLTKEEEKLLDSAATIFKLRDRSRGSNTGYAGTGSGNEKNYTTLGCKKTDDIDTIKSAYKKLVKDFHPDTIASKGLPEEFTKFATQKFKEINEAYEEIRKERGF